MPLLAEAATPVVARDLKLSSAADSTHLVVELSRRPTHKLFTLENPHRIVLDLGNTALAPGVRAPAAIGPVETVRTGVQPGRTLRIVLAMRSKAEPRITWTPRGAEQSLKVEIAATGAGAPTLSTTPSASAARPILNTPASGAVPATGQPPPAVTRALPPPPQPPSAVRASHAPPDSDRDVVVAIDAGHGGADPGAIGRAGTREKDVVLQIARELADRVNAEPGMRAVLTRDGDYYIAHRERIRRARIAKADLFVSIHADSIRDRDVSGSSVYVLSERGATDEAARWLAERENAADLKGGVTLDDKDDVIASVLLDLSQSASISASMEAAQRVLDSMRGVGEVRKPRVQQAGFLVLKSPDIPSMLVETAYISNPGDERRLRAGAHQEKLARAIFGGIRRYFEQNPPDGTRLARLRRGSVLASSEP